MRRRPPPSTERFRALRPDHKVSTAPAQSAKPVHAPKSWVRVVVADSGKTKAGGPTPTQKEGVVPVAAVASREAALVAMPMASSIAVPPQQSAAPISQIPPTAPNVWI